MEKQHLTYFKIENFKRFDSFEMSNLGQFNLIVGDNNVGKTSVLEGLLFNEDRIKYLFNLYIILFIRGISESFPRDVSQFGTLKKFWINLLKKVNYPLVVTIKDISALDNNIKLEFVESDSLTAEDKDFIAQQVLLNQSPDLWLRYYVNDRYMGVFGRYNEEVIEFRKNNNYFFISNFVSMNVGYTDAHLSSYFQNINSSKKLRIEFEQNLKLVLKNLEEIRPHKMFEREILGVVLSDDQAIYPITRFGDGVIKIMRILLGIFSTNGERIMIDEIDAGIHFSKLKEFWKVIFKMCHNQKVQLFATTHSLECQQAFIEALQDEDMQQFQADARNILMAEDKNGDVKSYTYTFEEFEFSIANNINTRGGRR